MQFPELKYNFDYSILELDTQTSIAYIDEGDKSSANILLFIHGLSSYIPAWQKLIPMLKTKFRCIAIDLPGYGKSSPSLHKAEITYFAKTVSSFIEKMNLNKVTLAGHSMGGQVAIQTSLEYPKVIDKLVLLAPAGFETFSGEEIDWIKKNTTPKSFYSVSNEQIRANYQINFYDMPKDIEFMIKDRIDMKEWQNYNNYCTIVSSALTSMITSPVFHKLNQIETNVLVLFGKNDRLIPHPVLHPNFTPEKIANLGASLINNSKLVMIDNCGHFLQFEKPGIVSQEIQTFLIK